MGSVSLSLCLIVKNEARHLPRCLQSAAGVVDEIVVIDTGSSDETVRIAQSCGARVFHADWRDDYALVRNLSLERATGGWVLVLDADEEIEPASRQRLQPVLATEMADALEVAIRNFAPTGEVVSYQDTRMVRLFRRDPRFRYTEPIHEQIRPAIERHGGRIVSSDLMIWHHGYAERKVQGGESRAARNLRILQQALEKAPNDPYYQYQIGVTYKSLGQAALAAHHLHRARELDRGALSWEMRELLFMKLAQLALAAGDHVSARGYAEASLAFNPSNALAGYVAALAGLEQQDLRQAYRHFARVRTLPEVNAQQRHNLDAVLAHIAPALTGS